MQGCIVKWMLPVIGKHSMLNWMSIVFFIFLIRYQWSNWCLLFSNPLSPQSKLFMYMDMSKIARWSFVLVAISTSFIQSNSWFSHNTSFVCLGVNLHSNPVVQQIGQQVLVHFKGTRSLWKKNINLTWGKQIDQQSFLCKSSPSVNCFMKCNDMMYYQLNDASQIEQSPGYYNLKTYELMLLKQLFRLCGVVKNNSRIGKERWWRRGNSKTACWPVG